MLVSVNLGLLLPMGKVVPLLLSNVSGKCATASENTADSIKHTHSVSDAGPSLMVVLFQTLFVLVNMLCSAVVVDDC